MGIAIIIMEDIMVRCCTWKQYQKFVRQNKSKIKSSTWASETELLLNLEDKEKQNEILLHQI